jgi:hypothetical protein
MMIHKSMTDCVCFVCGYNNNGELTPVGTASFMGVQIVKTDPPRCMGIAITAPLVPATGVTTPRPISYGQPAGTGNQRPS